MCLTIIWKGEQFLLLQIYMSTQNKYVGVIKQIIFTGEDNFAIISVKLSDGKVITALGKIPYPVKGSSIHMTGTIKYNEKQKQDQLYITSCKTNVDEKAACAIQFLGSGAIKGVRDATAVKIVSTLGSNIGKIMEDPERLLTVPGITYKKLKTIISSYEKNKSLFEIYEVTNGQITLHQAQSIQKKYGDKSFSILKNNPYQIIYDIKGFGFAKADALSKKIGFSFDSPERIMAGLVYCIRTAAQENGDCFLYYDALKERVINLLFSSKEMPCVYYNEVLHTSIPDDLSVWYDTVLGDLYKNHERKLKNIITQWADEDYRDKTCNKISFNTDEIETIDAFCERKIAIENQLNDLILKTAIDLKNYNIETAYKKAVSSTKQLVLYTDNFNENIIYDKNIFIEECEVAKMLLEHKNKPLSRIVPDDIIQAVIVSGDHDLDESQIDAIKMALTNRVSIITGGPGHGKTTIMDRVIQGWKSSYRIDSKGNKIKDEDEDDKPNFILLAPTGKAAQRLAESTGLKIMTIHKFAMQPSLCNANTFVIVDEITMAGIPLIRRLLQRVDMAHLLLVGDINQLRSIEYGNFLEDIIKSKVIPCTYLLHCHRNSGAILENNTKILEKCRLRELSVDNHFKTLWVNGDDATVSTNAIRYYKKMLEKYDVADVILLSAMRRGSSGMENLNRAIQKEVNPLVSGKQEISFRNTVFREGDRVMHIKNNYSLIRKYYENDEWHEEVGVFNGETGTIQNINTATDIVTVKFDDNSVVEYEYSVLDELELAYAITYHKSQGSEFPCVICILKPSDYVLLQNNLIYTGESRGKDIVTFLGVPKAFQMAIDDTGGVNAHRNTRLRYTIKEMTKQI